MEMTPLPTAEFCALRDLYRTCAALVQTAAVERLSPTMRAEIAKVARHVVQLKAAQYKPGYVLLDKPAFETHEAKD